MSTLRSIVCPIDLSSRAAHALRQAKALADVHGADLAAIAVRSGAGAALPLTPDAWEESAWTFVHDTIGAAHVRVLAGYGAMDSAVLHAAATLQADLIALPAYRHDSSAAPVDAPEAGILRRAACAVLVLPSASSGDELAGSWHTILCGIDPAGASRHVLAHAGVLAERSGSRLVVAHAVGGTTVRCALELRVECERLIPSHVARACGVRLVIAHGAPHEELPRLAHAWNAGLVIVGRGGRVPASGSLAEHLIHRDAGSVLMVPADRAAAWARPAFQATVDPVHAA